MQINLKLVPALAVVLTRPVNDHYAQAMYSIENGVNTYFQSFLVNNLTDLLAILHNDFPHYCLYPHQARPFQVPYSLSY